MSPQRQVASTGLPLDRMVYPVLQELAGCLCEIVNADGKLCYCGIIVGNDVPWVGDDCDAGVAFVRLDTAFPSTFQFPAPDARATDNSWRMAYNITVGILRPGIMPDEEGNVDPADYGKQAEWQLADMMAIRQAIECCFEAKFPDYQYILGTYTPVPGEGVAGGEWPLILGE